MVPGWQIVSAWFGIGQKKFLRGNYPACHPSRSLFDITAVTESYEFYVIVMWRWLTCGLIFVVFLVRVVIEG